MTDHLPTGECHELDLKTTEDGRMDFSFVKGMYLQPAMQEKEAFPDNFGVDREIAQEIMKFLTPPNSPPSDQTNAMSSFMRNGMK